ncbi:MAG: Na+ dependent nucleoside transporter N-terminal domain-containing protein, partial [Acidobacteriota bacterium]
MNAISFLGLLVLLGSAWALSYHRNKVRLRPIFWGIGLQFILALTILRRDVWSTVGLTLLGLLIVAFISDQGRRSFAEGWRTMVGACAAALVAGALLLQLSSQALGAAFVVLAAILLVTAKLPWRPMLRRAAGILLVVLGATWVIASGYNG